MSDTLANQEFVVPGMHCAGCMRRIEDGLTRLQGVKSARTNLSTRRVMVATADGRLSAPSIIQALADLGFEAAPFEPQLVGAADEEKSKFLLRALAVAGFATANIMLLSVAVWSGAAGSMSSTTREMFHWLSALVALPAVAYSVRPFASSAFGALKHRSMNMDVPITLAVLLSSAMSLFETIRGGEHVYFDAAVMLLFFLLIGRYLDTKMRAKACSAAENLLALQAVSAQVLQSDGTLEEVPVKALRPGLLLHVAAGERIAADGIVKTGSASLDVSLLTGESLPVLATAGDTVFAGTLNLSGPITVEVIASLDKTLLSEIIRMMELAEQGRARYVRIADRVARIYAPAVHLLAAATFVGWFIVGGDWHPALMTAVAVLIVTCPCALGLAVPVVQVTATGELLRDGILIKSGDALERLAAVDTIVFDKTGTLTLGKPVLENVAQISDANLALAAALARNSRHPLARAVVQAAGDVIGDQNVSCVEETPGFGISGNTAGEEVRLGSAVFVLGDKSPEAGDAALEFWLKCGDAQPVRFCFADRLRGDAGAVLAQLRNEGYNLYLLSGDRQAAVQAIAQELEIPDWQAKVSPDGKIAVIDKLIAEGKSVLMVGDGLNDAPALGTAQVSMSPSSAADISQIASDFVFQGTNLFPVVSALLTAKRSTRLVKQNFGLAFGYNAFAIPLAIAGFVTPVIAAIAMSASSLVVILNALRLKTKPSNELLS